MGKWPKVLRSRNRKTSFTSDVNAAKNILEAGLALIRLSSLFAREEEPIPELAPQEQPKQPTLSDYSPGWVYF